MTTKPEYHYHEEFQNRLQKLSDIRKDGIEPYPHHFKPTHCAKELVENYEGNEIGNSEDAAEGKTPPATAAGRLVLFRAMGKNAFAHIQDHSGRIQIMLNRDNTKLEGLTPNNGLTPLKYIEKKIDLGDIIGVEGHLFHTQKGELTLYVNKVILLSKTLLPLADKHAGLHDKELRYRKRWLDLISREDVRDTFKMRSKIFEMIREYMKKLDFLEVETPVLQSIYGGAEARPFETNLHALDQDMFLRISLEPPLKKLIVGGMNRVYEIGRVFRNEGIDRNHNPEFTLFEAYAAYWDYKDMMQFVENLVEKLALELYGTTKITAHNAETNNKPIEVDLKTPWKRLTMKEAIQEYGNIDVEKLSDKEMLKMLEESGHCDISKLNARGLIIAAMFDVFAQPHLIQPHHIYDHPKETTPLCKWHRDPKAKEEGLVERFESFVLAHELCNAYTELNDPVLQRELLEDQAKRRDAGDEEASPFDEEFVEAICQGMPPTGGVGIGLDRLVMLLTNAANIRDVLYFPWMKPQDQKEEQVPKKEKQKKT